MAAKILKNISGKVLIVGPIFGKIEKLNKIEDLINSYELIIINGSINSPFSKIEKIISNIEYIDSYNEKLIYNKSNDDLLIEYNCNNDYISNWYKNKPNIIILEYVNNTRYAILSGGITPNMDSKSILDNMEISFVNNINGIIWHKMYDGRFGYVISNNPLTSKSPEFYNFSANIGALAEANYINAQEIDKFGLSETLLI